MPQIKKILCPTDFGEPSRVALQAAVNMARFEGAELMLLHVLPSLGLVRGIAAVAALGQSIEDEAYEKLAALIDECVPSDVRAQPLIRIGEKADEIYLAALQADAVVMSSHGRTVRQHLPIGSVTQKVLHGVPCPVFLVPHSAAAPVALPHKTF